MVSQNRWFKYMPSRTNFIYPVLASYGVTMLKQAGFKVDFLDAPAENVSFEDVEKSMAHYDLLILEGRTAVMPRLWERVKAYKEINPGLQVAVYGDHVMNRPKEALERGFDYVIDCGDWDYGILNLAKELRRVGFADPVFSWPRMRDLNHLPLLDRDAVPWKNYFETWRHREQFSWIQSGRGCFGRCTYCSWNYTYYNCQIRTTKSEMVFKEIQHAQEKYGIREFLDDADTFITQPLGVELASRLLEEDLDVFWNIQTRADVICNTPLEDLKRMAKSGLHVVKLGVDGGHNYTLWRIRKGMSIEQPRIAVERLKEAGLEVHINMILGWPWETKKQAYDVIRFVKSLKPNQAQFGLIQPFIGTPIYEEAIKNDWFVQDPDAYEEWDMKYPLLNGEMNSLEISQLYKDAWSQFYFSPRYVLSQLFKATRLCFKHGNLDAFRHLWRGYKAVKNGHLRAVE